MYGPGLILAVCPSSQELSGAGREREQCGWTTAMRASG